MRLVKKYIYIKRSVCNFHRTKYSPEPRSGIIPSGHTYTVFEQTTAVCLKIKGRFNFIKGRFNFIKGRFNFIKGRFNFIKGRFIFIKGRFNFIKGRFNFIKGRFNFIKVDLIL